MKTDFEAQSSERIQEIIDRITANIHAAESIWIEELQRGRFCYRLPFGRIAARLPRM